MDTLSERNLEDNGEKLDEAIWVCLTLESKSLEGFINRFYYATHFVHLRVILDGEIHEMTLDQFKNAIKLYKLENRLTASLYHRLLETGISLLSDRLKRSYDKT